MTTRKIILILVFLAAAIVAFLLIFHFPSYRVILASYEHGARRNLGGFTEVNIRIVEEGITAENQQLINGRAFPIRAGWAEKAARVEEDYTIFVFRIEAHSASEVTPPGTGGLGFSGKEVAEAEVKTMRAIRHWLYQGDLTGPIALKLNWAEKRISIDVSRLRGASKIANLNDLVKGAPVGFEPVVIPFEYEKWH